MLSSKKLVLLFSQKRFSKKFFLAMPRTRASACVEEVVSEVNSDDDDEPTTCVICLDEITSDQKRHGGEIKLSRCTHVFHGQCIINHVCSNNITCPICRAYLCVPIGATEEDLEEVMPVEVMPEMPETQYISIRQAIKLGKKDKKNKSTQQSLQCLNKWKQTNKDARASIKEIETRLAPEEKLLKEKIKLFDEKLNAEFDFKYANDTLARKEHRKNITKARVAIRNIEVRIARKYGWGSLR